MTPHFLVSTKMSLSYIENAEDDIAFNEYLEEARRNFLQEEDIIERYDPDSEFILRNLWSDESNSVVEGFLDTLIIPPINTSNTPFTPVADLLNDIPVFEIEILKLAEFPNKSQVVKRVNDIIIKDAIENNYMCSITFEDISAENSACVAPCYHVFNREAILNWLKIQHTCPQCRQECSL